MLKQFVDWVLENCNDLSCQGITMGKIHISPTDSPNPSLSIDHDARSAIGRITIWESGEMDVEVIRKSTGERSFWHHYELDVESNISDLLLEYFLSLRQQEIG